MSKSKSGKLSMVSEPNYLQKRKKLSKRTTLEEVLRQPIMVSQEELDEVGGVIEDKCFIVKPVNNHNRGLLQATYWVVNGNQFKARETLKGLGLRSKRIKMFINGELSLHKKYPEQVEHLINKPMPKEYEMKNLN